jgi:hypothetical protein
MNRYATNRLGRILGASVIIMVALPRNASVTDIGDQRSRS